MSIESKHNSRPNWFALAIIFTFVTVSGCYQRTVPPELTYDQSQVEILDGELKKMEWE